MRLTLGQLAPVPHQVATNLDRVERAIGAAPSDLAIFPELFLSGYRVGDQIHSLAVSESTPAWQRLVEIAHRSGTAILVGAPRRRPDRAGEVENVALLIPPSGPVLAQVKRYLPTYGPFEEGSYFTPTDHSDPLPLGAHRLGVEICYDAFFPEVTRVLSLAGADLLVNISASPVTSRRLFEKVLPARAVENATPLVYVNRVGVEDGVVFGGGTNAWDARGESIPAESVPFEGALPEERLLRVEIDLVDASHWRPFRPVLRDVDARPPPPAIP
jgi:predicted amidohydrolase